MAPIARFSASEVRSPKSGKIALCVATATPKPANSTRQPGFFDVDDQLKRLSDLGDQLEACQAAVDFETFHPQLNSSRVCLTFGFCWGAGNG
jgi:hypothetical protein